MKVEQVYEIANQLSQEALGEAAPAIVDEQSLISVGKQVFDATSVDNYVRKLIDHIGRVVFVDRPYSGRAPSVLMESWEFGSVLEKIDMGIPDAEANPKWQLTNGKVYEQDKFTAPDDIVVQFFNDKTTFQVPMSYAEDQVKSAWSNLGQLNAFFSMIETAIEDSFTVKLDQFIMATIGNFIGYVYNNRATRPLQAINLLEGYKTATGDDAVTAANCLYSLPFLKYAAKTMKVWKRRMGQISRLFNSGGRVRHTPDDRMKVILLSDFAESADVYLQSDTYHNEFVKFPNAEKVSFWQGSGTEYTWDAISSLYVNVNTGAAAGTSVTVTGILGVMFDREALGVNNYNRRVTAHYNAPGEFINNWYKMDARYFNDFNENFILFYVAD